MNQHPRRITVMKQKGGKKSRDSIPLNKIFPEVLNGINNRLPAHPNKDIYRCLLFFAPRRPRWTGP